MPDFILNPQDKVPAFNPIMFVASGSSITAALPGYQFVFRLYEYTSALTTSLLKEDKRPIQPAKNGISGICEYDASATLQNIVSYDFKPTLTGVTAASGSSSLFLMTLTEEYIDTFIFNRTAGGTIGVTQYAIFSSSTDTHSYVSGDRINVTMNSSTNTNPQYNGVHTVLSAINTSSFVMDVPFAGTPATPESGTTIYANRRKTETPEPGIVPIYTVFNGALSHLDWRTYSSSTYTLTGSNTTHKFCTSMPKTSWEVRRNSRMFLNFFTEAANTPYAIYLYTFGSTAPSVNPIIPSSYIITGAVFFNFTAQLVLNDGGNPIPNGTLFTYVVDDGSPIGMANSGSGTIISSTGGTYTTTIPASVNAGALISGTTYFSLVSTPTPPNNQYLQGVYIITGNTFYSPTFCSLAQAGLGPWNLNNTSNIIIPAFSSGSTFPIITDSIKSYAFNYHSDYFGANLTSSQTYIVNIDDRCSYYNRDEIELLFKDSMGSFQTFTFQLKNEQNTEISRREFKKQIGSYKGAALGWTYNTYDRGRTIYDMDTQEKFTATADWLTSDANIVYLKDLFTTSEAYWVMDSANNVVVPIIITSKSYPTKKIINDRLVNAEITFELAYANPTNI